MATPELTLNRREQALLNAVAVGRGELTVSCEPDLFIDGVACCDQPTAHHLARTGYIQAADAPGIGPRTTAVLTARGRAALSPTE